MSTYVKTVQSPLLSLQSVAASTVVVGTPFDMTGKLGGIAYIRVGRRSATAAGAGADVRIEISSTASGDNSWVPLPYPTTTFAACEAEAVSGTVNAGTNVITVASTTNLTAGDMIYIDNGTIANSEWGIIKSISANVSVTIEDNLVNAQTGATLYDSAEKYSPITIPEGTIRVRAVANGASFTQAWAVHVAFSTIDSII
jgi:hypothetical protein